MAVSVAGMSQSARSPGVLLSVRWGDQDLAREFLRLDTPRAFTIGTESGCDFPCGGTRAFKLIEIDEDGAALRHKDGTRTPIERGEPAQLNLGPLSFQAQLLDAPPQVRAGAFAELTTINLCLLMMAAFGFFAVAAANSDAEGDDLADDLKGGTTRLVKTLFQENQRRAMSAAAEAAPQQKTQLKMERPASPNHQARKPPPLRPVGRNVPSKVDVGSIFRGPGAGSVFGSSGLGNELAIASTGMRTAEAGNGIGMAGKGLGVSGNGLGGMALQGIGNIGMRSTGGRGLDPHGTGMILKKGTDIPLPPPEIVGTGCALDGSGCLDKELIRRVIRDNIAGFRFCYESMLNRHPTLEGKVSMRFAIPQSGKVSTVEVSSSTANNAELEKCIASRTRLLQFPSRTMGGIVIVTYPFLFKQAGK